MARNPTDCCGIHTTCCGSPLKERLTLTVQSGERQVSVIVAYDAAQSSPQIWNGQAQIPASDRTEQIGTTVGISVQCQQGDWIMKINGKEAGESSFVECDPLLLEFHNIDFETSGMERKGNCSIYVTE